MLAKTKTATTVNNMDTSQTDNTPKLTQTILQDAPGWSTKLLTQIGVDNTLLEQLLDTDHPISWITLLAAAKNPNISGEAAQKIVEKLNQGIYTEDEKQHIIPRIIENPQIPVDTLIKLNYTQTHWIRDLTKTRNLTYTQLKTLLDKTPAAKKHLTDQILAATSTPANIIEQLANNSNLLNSGWIKAAKRDDLTKKTLQWINQNHTQSSYLLAGWTSRDDTTHHQIKQTIETLRQNPTKLLVSNYEHYNWILTGINRKTSIDAPTWTYITQTLLIPKKDTDLQTWLEHLLNLEKTTYRSGTELHNLLTCLQEALTQKPLQSCNFTKNKTLLHTVYQTGTQKLKKMTTAEKLTLQKWAAENNITPPSQNSKPKTLPVKQTNKPNLHIIHTTR